MKLPVVGALVVVAAVALATAAGARPERRAASALQPRSAHALIDPTLARRLASAGPNATVQAIVVLAAQAPLASRPRARRATRLAGIVRALERTARRAQRPVLRLLRHRRATGRVQKIVPLWIVDAVLVAAKPDVLRELAARADVRALVPNSTIAAPATDSSPPADPEANVSLVNAPSLWSLGYRGQGVVVASMDTGVDVSHPDLASSWRGGSNSWFDPNHEHPTTPTDVNGHGTQTMGVVVGGEAGGTAIGVAPEAKWIAVKMFDDHDKATTAGIHQGFQWLLDPDGDPSTADAPNVVNNSWVVGSHGACDFEFEPDLRALRSAGVLPLFAAGNRGPDADTSFSPANNPEAFAVGGTDNSEALGPWSSRGPSACDGGTFPRIVAPGTDIRTTDLFGFYETASGTSMAAPHAAGVLALLLGAFPGLSADRQQSALENGAVDLGAAGPDNDFGYGRLDSLGAYNWLTTAPDFSLAATPGLSTTPAGGSVSYTVSSSPINGFAGDVALSLSGLAPSQATWSLSQDSVTGGSGTSELTVTTSASLAPGSYPLTIKAISGGLTRSSYLVLLVTAPPDFRLTTSVSSATTPLGSVAALTVDVGSVNDFAGDVALTLQGLTTSQASWSFSPTSVNGSGSSQLEIMAPPSLGVGSHPLTITGTSGAITHAVAVELVATAAPDFALLVGPSSQTVKAGRSVSYNVSLEALHGFSGAVALSIGGLPSRVLATFLPSPVFPGVFATLVIDTSRHSPRGTFAITVTGASGSLAREVTTMLTVSGGSKLRARHHHSDLQRRHLHRTRLRARPGSRAIKKTP